MIVAIDGPSGAGKSTVAKAAAKRLGFSCLDTGAMYRAIAWKALADGVSFDDAEALGAIARDNEIEFGHVEGDPVPRRVFISGTEVTDAIRTSEIDRAVGPVAAVPAVREALVAQQQRIGRAGDYVVEGRDIGTVVFPRGTREGVPHGKRGGACNPSCQAERGASRGFDELRGGSRRHQEARRDRFLARRVAPQAGGRRRAS